MDKVNLEGYNIEIMGYEKHHCIVVTSFNETIIEGAHKKASEIFDTSAFFLSQNASMVTPILTSPVNSYYTFFIGPDGSKEGWSDSDLGDKLREEFIQYCKSQNYLEWALIRYFDEYGTAEIEENFHTHELATN